jgi:CRAL/TRIO domain
MVLISSGKFDVDNLRTLACFVNFYIMNYMHRSGKIENNLFLIDLEHAGLFALPIKNAAAVEETMKTYFKCLTAKIFVLNCSKAFVFGWSAVRNFLDPLVA